MGITKKEISPKKSIVYNTFCKQWVADGIGEEYKKWMINYHQKDTEVRIKRNIIFISSCTGTGKTYFIINKLIKSAIGNRKSVLYLTNRVAAAEHVQMEIKALLDEIIGPANYSYEDNGKVKEKGKRNSERKRKIVYTFSLGVGGSVPEIQIMTYQGLPDWEKANDNDIYTYCWDYIILDEVHFFVEDAPFNARTHSTFTHLLHSNKAWSTFVIASATIEDIIGPIYEELELAGMSYNDIHPLNSYQVMTNTETMWYINEYRKGHYSVYEYSQIRQIADIIKREKQDEKWLVFVSSIVEGNLLKTELSRNGISTAFLSASKKKSKVWNRLIKDEIFDERVLVATKVIDNSININDKTVKNVVLPFCYKTDFMQMLGRKRMGEDESVNLYVMHPDKKAVLGRMKLLNEQIKYMNKALNLCEHRQYSGLIYLVKELWEKGDQRINRLFYFDIKYINRYYPPALYLRTNDFALYKAQITKDFYEKILSDKTDYLDFVKQWLGMDCDGEIAVASKWKFRNFKELLDYGLSNTIPNEDRAEFYNTFQKLFNNEIVEKSNNGAGQSLRDAAKRIRKSPKIRKSTMNKELKLLELPYEVIKKNKEWTIEKRNDRATSN